MQLAFGISQSNAKVIFKINIRLYSFKVHNNDSNSTDAKKFSFTISSRLISEFGKVLKNTFCFGRKENFQTQYLGIKIL